MFPFPIFLN